MTDTRAVIVDSDGRAKVYRPLPESDRASAITAGLAAYDRGDFFAAHEHLEPAWMGTADPLERAWLQGLIKLAAAYVHAVRRNPAGIAKNLAGARSRLAEGATGMPRVTIPGGSQLDIGDLIDAIDLRLAELAAHPSRATLGPPVLRRSAS
jgi:predicted metal-dependent hydrolase